MTRVTPPLSLQTCDPCCCCFSSFFSAFFKCHKAATAPKVQRGDKVRRHSLSRHQCSCHCPKYLMRKKHIVTTTTLLGISLGPRKKQETMAALVCVRFSRKISVQY